MILSGFLYDAGGPLGNITITFEATRTTQNGVLIGADHDFTTQEDGSYYLDLRAGYYNVYWIERGRRVRLGTVTADAFSEASLPEALKADDTPVDSDALRDEIQAAIDQMRLDLQQSQQARDDALDYRNDAQDARDAAQLTAGVYDSVGAGEAATASGEYFSVAGAGEVFLTLYRHNAGGATLISTYLSSAGVEQRLSNNTTQFVALMDSLGVELGATRLDFQHQSYFSQ